MTIQDPKYKHKPSEKHTLEEVLKSLQDLIRNDLLDEDRPVQPAGQSAAAPEAVREEPAPAPAAPVRENFTPLDPASGPVDFDAVMRSLKDLVNNELNVGDEPMMPGPSSLSDTTSPETLEELADELAPLDEELTFEEAMEIVPPAPLESAMPELPGEISAEMLAEPEPEATPPAEPVVAETPPAPAEPKPASREPAAPGTQQELVFDVEPPAIEARTPFREQTPETKIETPSPAAEPEAPPENPAPEIPREPMSNRTASDATGIVVEENLQASSDEPLPTIDVEETFDESAFVETAEPAKQAPTTDSAESDELITIEHAPDLGFSETSPDLSNEPLTLEELTLAPEPEKPELKLEEPASENLRDMPSVDFETIEFQPPGGEALASSANAEAPKPDEKSLSIAKEASLIPKATPESAPKSETPATVETVTETAPDTTKLPSPEETGSPAAAGLPEPPASAEPPVTPKAPETFSLDDIPVLNEVVAAPAGSTLAGEPSPAKTQPSLPAPDRARDIVVRAVAKLNVEMRKTGGAGLDTKTILRLQQLIRQELEQDGGKS